MSENNRIPASIQNAWQEDKTNRGNCPGAEKLTAYQQRLLPMEETIQIQRHIESCGLCDWEITAMGRFDSETQPRSVNPVRRVLFSPVFAYLVVLALLYPAYRGLFVEPEVREKIIERTKPAPAPEVLSARSIDLGEVTRQRDGSAKPVPIVEFDPDEKWLILDFFLPVHPAHRYELAIADGEGEIIKPAIPIRSRDPIGNFSIIVPTSLFSAGSYTLRVSEIDKSSNRELDQYSIPFLISGKK